MHTQPSAALQGPICCWGQRPRPGLIKSQAWPSFSENSGAYAYLPPTPWGCEVSQGVTRSTKTSHCRKEQAQQPMTRVLSPCCTLESWGALNTLPPPSRLSHC